MQGIYPLFGVARERTDSFLSHSTAQSHTGAATSLKTEQGISWGISVNETGIQARLLRSSILRLVPEITGSNSVFASGVWVRGYGNVL